MPISVFNIQIVPLYPFNVIKTEYYSGFDFISSFGGTLSFIQVVTSIFCSFFIYEAYSGFMAHRIYENQRARAEAMAESESQN